MENFRSVKVTNPLLKKYIDSFYFHQCDETEESKCITFFPHVNNALTIYKNATVKIIHESPLSIEVLHAEAPNFSFLYGGIQEKYIVSTMKTPFTKIGVIFNPLGINHFVRIPNLGLKLRKDFYFPFFEELIEADLCKVFEEPLIAKKVEILEAFFINSFNPDFCEPEVEQAIELIETSDKNLKINEIAAQLSINNKTLCRKFKHNLNCTPKHYHKVFHFRKAIHEYQRNNKNVKLTDLAFQGAYYDQSDFIKNFKLLTGDKPLKILKRIEDFGNAIFWIK